MKQIKIADATVITKEELTARFEEEENNGCECTEWMGLCEGDDGRLYTEWMDTRFGKSLVVPELRTIHFGLNSIPDDKVQELIEVVEREGGAAASWSCDGRTRHHMLACKLAEMLSQYRFDIGYNYKCEVYKEVTA